MDNFIDLIVVALFMVGFNGLVFLGNYGMFKVVVITLDVFVAIVVASYLHHNLKPVKRVS